MELKKILVLGVGAQGSAAAKRLDEDPGVAEIICADYDKKAVDNLVKDMKKAKGVQVDAHSKESIVRAARGVDLILNALPLECTKNVLDAALEVKANYQDYAATTSLHEDWVESIRIQYDVYGPKFEEIGRTAIVGTGSAPGLICAATRDAMRYLDSCDTIYNIVWEGVEAKRFQPFWWSPVTALHDMSEEAYAFVDGKLIACGKIDELARQVQQEDNYVLETAAIPDDGGFEAVLKSLGNVRQVEHQGEFYVVRSSCDVRRELLRKSLDQGYTLSHLRQRGGDLDEIYRRYFEKADGEAGENRGKGKITAFRNRKND